MTAGDEDWEAPLRRASHGSAQAGIETLHGAPPSLLNAQTAGALTSAILAAFVCLAARFRSELTGAQLDLIASVLRTAAVAFVLRALIDFARAAHALWSDRAAKDATLALAASGLYLRRGQREESARKEEVLGLASQDALPSRTLAVRPAPVLVALTPLAGRPRVLTLPPYFAQTGEIALARLARWRGTPPARAAREPRSAAAEAPEAHYERAARGQLDADDVLIPEGRGYLLRAPYTALLGLAFALDVFLSAGKSRSLIAMPVLSACALSAFVLAAWFVWIGRRRQSRAGIGMLLTRDELLLRGPRGVVAVPWPQLAEIDIKLSARWSPFVGSYAARLLTLSTNTGERMLFDQSFLGVPIEVIALLCRHYRDDRQGEDVASEPLA
jgi:hypothetical protein